MKNIKNKITENRVYLLSVLIITAVFLICLLIAERYPFGTLPAIKGDGIGQLYAKHVENISEIKKNGLPYYNTFSSGGFLNMFGYRIYDLLNPWLIIKYYFLGSSLTLLDYTFSMFLNLILSSVSIIFYLSHRADNSFEKKDMRLLPISLIYTLCTYNLIMFSYESFKYACYLPFIILGLEQLVYKNKKSLFICIMVLMFIYGAYPAFILCEFLALYFLTMHFEDVKDFLRKAVRLGVSSLAAAGLTAVYLIPSYMLLSSSSYIETDNTAPSTLGLFDSIWDMFSGYRSLRNMEPVSSDRGQAAIYAGLVMLFVIPLFVLCKELKLSTRIRRTVLLLILFVSFNLGLLNYILHGFHFQTNVPNRYAIFFVFLLITMLCDVLINSKSISNRQLLCCVLIPSCFFSVIYMVFVGSSKGSAVYSTVLLALYSLSAVGCIVVGINAKSFFKAMVFVTAIELIINCLVVFPKQLDGNSEIVSDAEKINEVADKYPDMQKFYNLTEYVGDHQLYHNLGQLTNINTLSYFSSDYTSDMMHRMQYYNMSTGANNMNYYGGNPLANMMMGVKYHIIDIGNSAPYSVYDNSETFNDYVISENPNYISFGFVIPDEYIDNINNIKQDDFKDPFEYQNAISKVFGAGDIYTVITCEPQVSGAPLNEDLSYFSIEPSAYDYDGSNYRNVFFQIGNNINGNLYTSNKTEIFYIGEINRENRAAAFSFKEDELNEVENHPYVAVYNKDALAELHEKLSESKLENVEYKDNKITGSINASQDGMLYISLPYYDSWDITIDGKSVDKSNFMGGIGVRVSAGNHTLSMKYNMPGIIPGIIVSIATLLIILVFALYRLSPRYSESSK